jgi:1-acyl-sn-glycerol-3-phosphate acyltransferase
MCRILGHPGRRRRYADTVYWFLRLTVVRPVLFGYLRVRVLGRENLPRRGAAILVSNHLAFVDSLILPSVVPRKITYLVGSNYFTKSGLLGRLMGWFLKQIGMLPIDRAGGSAAKAALDLGLQVLSENGLIGIYPEGTRSKDGKMHKGRTGVARLALEAGVPLVPASIQGTDRILQKGKRFPQRAEITITIGQPLFFETVVGDHDAARLRAVTDEVMGAIRALTPQEYVDAYAVSSGG